MVTVYSENAIQVCTHGQALVMVQTRVTQCPGSAPPIRWILQLSVYEPSTALEWFRQQWQESLALSDRRAQRRPGPQLVPMAVGTDQLCRNGLIW